MINESRNNRSDARLSPNTAAEMAPLAVLKTRLRSSGRAVNVAQSFPERNEERQSYAAMNHEPD